jgi:hypothetical protein
LSCESIEQANVLENRLTRPKVISIIGEIVNGSFILIGELPRAGTVVCLNACIVTFCWKIYPSFLTKTTLIDAANASLFAS